MKKSICVIGSGVIGASASWQLAKRGFAVTIIDPLIKTPLIQSNGLNGSNASLGVLMGNIFKKSKGKSWELRQKSMKLWPKWIEELSTKENELEIEKPLVRLFTSSEETNLYKKIIKERDSLGLKCIDQQKLDYFKNILGNHIYGGLLSKNDGRINPLKLLPELFNKLDKYKVKKIEAEVIKIERSSYRNQNWYIHTNKGHSINYNNIIICASLASQSLLLPLGHNYPMAPILGQAIEIEIRKDHKINLSRWPAVIMNQGVNLIPLTENKILLGATLEAGECPSQENLELMKSIHGCKPNWIEDSITRNHWHGIRARPINRGAPILQELEPGLILCAGHYRNGVLLAPATAEWILKKII